jgi:hypothetical protein
LAAELDPVTAPSNMPQLPTCLIAHHRRSAEDITPRETLDKALAAFDVGGFHARQAADRERGIHRGLGICCVVEPTTYGSAFYKAAAFPARAMNLAGSRSSHRAPLMLRSG